jgi:hypothetical protein
MEKQNSIPNSKTLDWSRQRFIVFSHASEASPTPDQGLSTLRRSTAQR